jgi:hypothetical protein
MKQRMNCKASATVLAPEEGRAFQRDLSSRDIPGFLTEFWLREMKKALEVPDR